jgi:hypothetical protein
MTKFPIRTVNEIRSTFPLTLTLTDGRIPPIVGDPTAKELLRVQAVIRACAKSQHSEFSNLGHSFLAKPPTVMATYGEAPFVRPTKPSVGPQPDFIGNLSFKPKWKLPMTHGLETMPTDKISITLIKPCSFEPSTPPSSKTSNRTSPPPRTSLWSSHPR